MTPVTDPELLRLLESGPKPVTDPALLAQLDAPAAPIGASPAADQSLRDAPAPGTDLSRSLKYQTQRVGGGLANVAGMPMDYASLMANANRGIINAAASLTPWKISVPYITNPAGGSEALKKSAFDAANRAATTPDAPSTLPRSLPEAFGGIFGTVAGAPVQDTEVTPNEKLIGDMTDFATQAVVTGAPMAVAGAGRQAVIKGGDIAHRAGDALLRPYFQRPVRMVVGDAAGGAGAGAASNFAERTLPEKQPDSPWMNAVIDVAKGVIPILGGIGGATAASAVENVGHGVAGAFTRATRGKYDTSVNVEGRPNIPLDSKNPNEPPFTRREVEKASRMVQAMPSDVEKTVKNIRTTADAFKQEGLPVPTVGLISGDVGMQSAENAARTQNGVPFIESDNRLRAEATKRVNSLRDPGADQTQPRAVAQTEASLRTGEARRAANEGIRAAETEAAEGATLARSFETDAQRRITDLDQQSQQRSAPIAAGANADAKAQASRRLDTEIVERGYIPERARKNAMFDNAPGRGDQLPADDVFAAIDDVVARNNALRPDAQLPQDFIARLNKLRPKWQDDPENPGTKINVGGPGTARGGDLADTRKYMTTAYEQAQRAGNFDLADSISTLRRAINATIEGAPGYAEANTNYQDFAGVYRPSRNDEAAKFTRQIDRDPQRGSTPPSQTAERFLAGPEKTAALQRMVQGTNGAGAVRDFLRSDFGMVALNPNGTLNPNRAAAWARSNADTLSAFPAIRQEFDDMVATARRGEELSTEARANLDNARRGVSAAEQEGGRSVRAAERAGAERVRTTEQEIERSAVGTLLKEDPRDVAARLFGSPKYGAEKELDEIKKVIGADKEANRGWKAAVSEYLSDQVTGTTKAGANTAGATPEFKAELSKLDKMFKDNRALLAKVYDPADMNTLQQAHKVLEVLKNATVRATGGSDTANKWASWLRAAEAGLKAKYGILKGGGIFRTVKLMASTLPDDGNRVNALVARTWFNPDTAEYLLTNKVRNLDAPTSSRHVKALLGGAATARSNTEDE